MLSVLVLGWLVLPRPARAGWDEELNIQIAACQAKDPAACLKAAASMDRRHVASRFGRSADDLRAMAYGELDRRCDANDGDACMTYGKLLARTGAPVDTARSVQLIERACTLGNGPACLHLGYEARPPRALALFEQACSHGSGEGCEQVAVRVARSDPARARALHQQACEGDYGPGCVAAAEAHRAAGERDAAFAAFGHACDLEQSASCDAAGQLAPDPATARELFQRACDGDVASGCAHLARMVAHGDGGPRDYGHGIDLAEQACTLAHDARCAQAAELRAHPPAIQCTTEDACAPLCAERIPLACRAYADAELRGGDDVSASQDYGDACTLGDAPSCLRAGDLATTWDEAGPAYARACALHDATGCLYATYGRALDGAAADLARLAQRCAGHDLLACTLEGLAEVDRAPARAAQRWRTACAAGRADACRLLGEYDDTLSYGVCDCDANETPQQRRLEQLEARRRNERQAVLSRACSLGDAAACDELGTAPPAGARRDPAWERTDSWELQPRKK